MGIRYVGRTTAFNVRWLTSHVTETGERRASGALRLRDLRVSGGKIEESAEFTSFFSRKREIGNQAV